MKKVSVMEALEERVVFRTSRLFFLSLSFVALLAFVAGAAYFAWGLTPTAKGTVKKPPVPSEVKITHDDVAKSIAAEKAKASKSAPESMADTAPSPVKAAADPLEAKWKAFNERLDVVLPESTYNRGAVIGKLKSFMEEVALANPEEQLALLSELLDVVEGFPLEDRAAPFVQFIKLYQDRHGERKTQAAKDESTYQNDVQAVETRFAQETAGKTEGRYKGIMTAAGAVSSMAFLGIFLVLLSMQRSIRKLTEDLAPSRGDPSPSVSASPSSAEGKPEVDSVQTAERGVGGAEGAHP